MQYFFYEEFMRARGFGTFTVRRFKHLDGIGVVMGDEPKAS